MAAKPFDYSKWDRIELSDDEDDVHPNIDKESWFRWKHKARVEREEKEKKEVEQLNEMLGLARARRDELTGKLKAAEEGAGEGDAAALKAELKEVERDIKTATDKLDEIERSRKLNVDNIGTVVKDYTFINKRETTDVLPETFKPPSPTSGGSSPTVTPGSPPVAKTDLPPPQKKAEPAASASATSATPPPPPTTEPKAAEPGAKSDLEQVENYNAFVTHYQDLLEEFSELKSLEETKQMIHNNGHILLAEHAQSYLLLSCLEDEMNGKHERMKNTAKQSQLLTHISELATSLHRSPRDVVLPFFHRLESPEHLHSFLDAVSVFVDRIEKRAVEKRKEMDMEQEYEEVEVPLEERLGPGGLDPVEVFQNLPIELQEAFEERDMEKLHKALASLPIEDAKKYMKQCEDSGLWVPSKSSEEA